MEKRFLTSSSSSIHNSFVVKRLQMWEEEEQRQRQSRSSNEPIEITLPDGTVKKGIAHKTTPLDVAQEISKGLSKAVIVAVVNGKPWDLFRPLTSHCSLRLLKHDEKIDGGEGEPISATEVFWHSSAHILGSAIESVYGEDALLCDGPALVPSSGGDLSSSGFFYDFYLKGNKHVSVQDFEKLEAYATQLTKGSTPPSLPSSSSSSSSIPFSRLVVDREFAARMFDYNPFKLRMLEKIPRGEQVTLYRCGSFVDLCRGPHLPSTNKIRAFKLLKTSSTYWNGDAREGESLQRVYGISFPDETQLKRWLQVREEASKRDHRVIGKSQKLFMFHDYAPGNPFFLPHGARVVNKLIELIRREYKERGYEEVITPQLFSSKLWQTSGHWDHYKDDMFFFEDTHAHSCADHANANDHQHHPDSTSISSPSTAAIGETKAYIGLKPMNCPAHCLIFKQTSRSYRELPVRFADFGALHRNEMVGALRGLTRVRRFHQDDAHIFCREDQIGDEIKSCLEFVSRIYSIFGFKFELRLSTRPETQFIGSIDVWNKAEAALKEALDATFGQSSWSVNKGDGAFYGPKIDIALTDALDRKHQCATIQLDFQLPQRFGLEYLGADNKPHTPVIIHRAIFGSIERMLAIIIEHTAGNWPLWLSPRQVAILPVSNKNAKVTEFAQMVAKRLVDSGIYADVNTNDDRTLDKRILEAQQLKYNYTLVVGEKECNANSVMVRSRDTYHQDKKLTELPLDSFVQTLSEQIHSFK